jgi:hypothetical protein
MASRTPLGSPRKVEPGCSAGAAVGTHPISMRSTRAMKACADSSVRGLGGGWLRARRALAC